MSTPLRITLTLAVTPLFDIQHEDVEQAYRQGVSDGLRYHRRPISMTLLFLPFKRALAAHTFDKQHESETHRFLGFHLGRMHGAILTAHGTRRLNAFTLITLDNKDARRGYDVGREWFFLESEPEERRFTDDALLKRFYDDAQEEEAVHPNDDDVWRYTLGCIVGELSGHVFPASEREHARWKRQNQRVLAEMAREEAQHRQRDIEPLDPVPVHPYMV